MEEFLTGVLLALGEALFELFLEFALGALLAFVATALKSLFKAFAGARPILSAIAFALLGAAAGAFSLLVFPHPLFHPSRFHGVSLVFIPLAAGWAMSVVGRYRRRRGRDAVRIESFGYGYTFALALALIRFLFVK